MGTSQAGGRGERRFSGSFRHVVTDEDFIGSYYQVEYVIRKEKLKKDVSLVRSL